MNAVLVDTEVVGLLFRNGPECEPYTAPTLGRGACRRPGVGSRRDVPQWIAATALLYPVPLLTHNPNRYYGIAALEAISFTE